MREAGLNEEVGVDLSVMVSGSFLRPIAKTCQSANGPNLVMRKQERSELEHIRFNLGHILLP